ncbi:MAG TPA: LCP family protein, partial [Actinomycetota bacterium]|nr:LCP family protein [Actinomycetota bacterium]
MRNPLRRSTGPAQDLSAVFRGVKTRGRRRVRRWHLIALALVILIGALGGWAAWFYFSTQAGIHASIPDVQKESEGKPFNVLLVGSDSRKGLTEKEQQSLGAADVGSQRSDTIILAHVDPDTDHVTMVQFPRDLYVEIPGHGKNKINTAYIHGRRTLVKTIEHLSGLPINHYVEVNIAGFRALVNAIEGVDVCVPEVIPFDSNTGIAIEEPGMYHFDGDAALRFVRSRHTIATGDIGRIANQQKFLSAALDKLTSTGTFFHLARVLKLKPIAEKYVTTDEGTTILGLWRIAKRLRSFDPEKYEAYVA